MEVARPFLPGLEDEGDLLPFRRAEGVAAGTCQELLRLALEHDLMAVPENRRPRQILVGVGVAEQVNVSVQPAMVKDRGSRLPGCKQDRQARLGFEDLVRQLSPVHVTWQTKSRQQEVVATTLGTDDLRDILTDAIGVGSVPPIVDVERLRLCDNDLVLLCSDGRSSALDGETIADVLAQPRTLNDLCQQLIDLAEGHNADDDATAVLARYRTPAE